MNKIYILMKSYDDGEISDPITGDWIVAESGYFSSFAEAKAEAKKLIRKIFSIGDDYPISETEDGWESDFGNYGGYFVWCKITVIELKEHI